MHHHLDLETAAFGIMVGVVPVIKVGVYKARPDIELFLMVHLP